MIEVILGDLPPDVQNKVENEIRNIFETTLGSRDPSPIKCLVITPKFADTVRHYSKFPKDRTYDPIHDYGIAIAKILPIIESGELRFILVFNSQCLGSLGDENLLGRLAIYAHELKHVDDFSWRSEVEGYSWIFNEPKTKDEVFFENAWRIASEYFSERFVGRIISGAVNEIGGTVTFSTTIGHLGAVEKMLSDLDSYLEMNIKAFRDGQLDIDGILKSNSGRVLSILMLCAYVYSVGESNAEVRQKLDKLEENPIFKRFFAEEWVAIHEALQRYYDEIDYANAKLSLNHVSIECARILEKCGMRLSDTKKGLWLEVIDL